MQIDAELERILESQLKKKSKDDLLETGIRNRDMMHHLLDNNEPLPDHLQQRLDWVNQTCKVVLEILKISCKNYDDHSIIDCVNTHDLLDVLETTIAALQKNQPKK